MPCVSPPILPRSMLQLLSRSSDHLSPRSNWLCRRFFRCGKVVQSIITLQWTVFDTPSILNLDSFNCFLFDVTWKVSDAGGKSNKWEQRNKAALTMTIDIDQDVFIGLWPAARLTSVVHETLGKRPWIFVAKMQLAGFDIWWKSFLRFRTTFSTALLEHPLQP